MKSIAAVAAAALVGASSAGAVVPDFAGVGGLPEALSFIQAQALRQRFAASNPPAIASGPDVKPYPVRGIDVSVFQGIIDWKQVAGAGISFAFIKATEGATMTDTAFSANWASAGYAGLRRGAYHFYNFCRDGSSQADNFIATVPKDPNALPPVVDLEQSPDCGAMPARGAFRPQLAAFLAKVQAFYGKAPILYVTYSIYDQYLSGANDPYKIWIADYQHAAPLSTGNAGWTFWQYGDQGKVAGIPGAVDVDAFNGSSALLAALSAPSGIMVAQP